MSRKDMIPFECPVCNYTTRVHRDVAEKTDRDGTPTFFISCSHTGRKDNEKPVSMRRVA